MRVLFVTPYFPPEVGAPQTRIYELALRLSKMGHEISVLTTFPNYPSGIVPKEWRGKWFTKTIQEGLSIYRVWSYATPNRGFLKRITSHLTFAISATLAALLLPRTDTMIVESPPLFDGFIGVFASTLRSIPYLFTVSDLWPESAIQMGMLKNQLLIRLSKSIELLFYRRASAVLALTAGIRDKIIADHIPASKVLLFRNSVDCELFHPAPVLGEFRSEIGVRNSDFLVLYAGTFGLAQNLGTVLDASHQLQNQGRSGIHFVLAGDGAESDILRAKAEAQGLLNLSFLSSLPKARVPELLNAADCVLVPLRNLEIFRGALPTKMFEAMACGKPLVLSVAGEAAELVEAAGAGICVAPEDSVAIQQAILALNKDRSGARRMGDNGRAFVLQHFSRDARALELNQALETLFSPPARKLPNLPSERRSTQFQKTTGVTPHD